MVKKQKRLTREERNNKKFISGTRSIFTRSGFKRIPGIANKKITFEKISSDLDDVYIYDNIIIIAEYTTSSPGNIKEHITGKKTLYENIKNNKKLFIEYLKTKFPKFREILEDKYHISKYKIIIIYCSLHEFDERHKKHLEDLVHFFDYPMQKYFEFVVKSIRHTAKFEFLSFLGLKMDDVQAFASPHGGSTLDSFKGNLLPESHSNFEDGFKIVSYYVSPEALLPRCYVLRKDGWRPEHGLYQRMISKYKIDKIRKHLCEQKRVFINNIITTLPSSTKILDDHNNTISANNISETSPIKIQLPMEFDSIGIIDGQHRVYSYHEGGAGDNVIAKLRTQQNLLVTGIIYPPNHPDSKRLKFEAQLFMEINSNQTSAKSDLKQTISLILHPNSPISIGKRIITNLSNSGPLKNHIETYFFDKQRLKTSSIVSYGLVPLVKLSGTDSLYSVWDKPKKETLNNPDSEGIQEEYIKFCTEQINLFLRAVSNNLPDELWTPDRKVDGRLITSTNINGFIICLRKVIKNVGILPFGNYNSRLKNLEKFDFKKYKSSQWNRMAESLFEKYFS